MRGLPVLKLTTIFILDVITDIKNSA